MTIKAIETVYKGYRFRSRLEARWAVFFDTLGIQWEYEKEGYDLGEAGWYLPDFWLPQVEMWAEVKPDLLSDEESAKVEALIMQSHKSVLLLIGVPDTHEYMAGHFWLSCEEEENRPTQCVPYPECCAECESAAGEVIYYDYALTMYHNYPILEGRFFSSPEGQVFEDTRKAVAAARSARFEHGQAPRQYPAART